MIKLVKTSLDKLFKKSFNTSEDITIEKTFEKRCELISDLTNFIKDKTFKKYFDINTSNLEEKIALCKKNFQKRKASDDFYFYRYGAQTEEEYIQEQIYSNTFGRHIDTFLLEKYKPTQKIANEVLLCRLNLSPMAQSSIFFAFYFNDTSQLCFDYIAIKGRARMSQVSLENDIKILSKKTNTVAIKKLICSFPDEEDKIEEESKIRMERNEKKQVKKDKIKELSSKAILARLKTMLDEKDISYFIVEQVQIIKIYLKMNKGRTVIRVPRKDIKTRLEILPSLCEKIIEADNLNIQCKYKQNLNI